MENLLITPDEAKNIAKAMFISYHPNNDLWFDIAWEVLEENELQHTPASNLRLLPGLAATGETSSDMALVADDFAMFFEVFMTKDPVRGTELAERIQNIAMQRSGGTFTRNNMRKRFSAVLELTDNDKFHSVNEMIKGQFEELSGQIDKLEGQIHISSGVVIDEIKKHSDPLIRNNNSETINLSYFELYVNDIIKKGNSPIPSLFDYPAYFLIWNAADSIMIIIHNQKSYYISFKDSDSASKVIQCLINNKKNTEGGMATINDLLASVELALSDPQVLYNIMTTIRKKITVNCVNITGENVIDTVRRKGKYFITTHKDNIVIYND